MKFADEKRASVESGGRPYLSNISCWSFEKHHGEGPRTVQGLIKPKDVKVLWPNEQLDHQQHRTSAVDETMRNSQETLSSWKFAVGTDSVCVYIGRVTADIAAGRDAFQLIGVMTGPLYGLEGSRILCL